MKRKEDQFFEMFRESFNDFEPQVPDSIYTGIRNKMSWSKFLAFSATSLNVWYLALVLAGTAGLLFMGGGRDSVASKATNPKAASSFVAPQVVEAAATDDATAQDVVEVTMVAAQNWVPSTVTKNTSKTSDSSLSKNSLSASNDESTANWVEEQDAHIMTASASKEPMVFIKASPLAVPYHLESTRDIVAHDILSQLKDDSKETLSIDIIVQRPSKQE